MLRHIAAFEWRYQLKSPVFWVLAAVGVYVLIVLADDGSNNAQTGRMLPLPEGAPRMSTGPTVFSF